jgi:hypothetical protein
MNQNVNPVVAFFIIAITISIIGFKYWANGEALQVRGPDQMQHDMDGNLYLAIQDSLYKLSPDLDLLAEYSLDKLGVYDLVGDFGLFSDGDILIRRGKYDPSFIENIFAYLRLSDALPSSPNTTSDGLYRCNLQTSECNAFGDLSKDFDSAFHLAIDQATDDVYLTDTPHHAIYKFDKDGNVLAELHKGYLFPNQISYFDNELYIADTNHHNIQLANPETTNFANIEQSYKSSNQKVSSRSWTYSFARIGNNWWVNNMGGDMSHGQILIFDNNWQSDTTLALPDNADPMDIATLGDHVLVTDLENNDIYLFDRYGLQINLPLPEAIQEKLALNKEKKEYYVEMDKTGTMALILFIALGFIGAVIHARLQGQTVPASEKQQIKIDIKDPGVTWIKKNTRNILMMRFLFGLIIIMMMIMIFSLYGSTHKPELVKSAIPMLLIIIIIFYFMQKQVASQIGYIGDLLVIKDANGRYSVGKGDRIYYSDNHILIDNIFVQYGRSQVFDTSSVVQEVIPRLKNATYIKPGIMLNLMIKNMSLADIAKLAAGILIVLVAFFLY